ncbi:phage holin family protein [Agromyces sp. NPDC056523]|uniref:phage holin family protein n=1 Tax=Agromyces sp. NPDC056523 TaxID=3345850 RepID=UPI00366A682B
MVRFLVIVVISLVMSAVGLLLAAWLLPDFHLDTGGFLVAVIVFTLAQALLAPLATRLARRHASAILGGIGLVSTFLALLIASLFPGGIRIDDVMAWVLATLLLWVVTALGTWLIPLLVFRKRRSDRATA